MKFSDLVSSSRVLKRSGGDLLVIIPCFREHDLLLEHLSLLSRQTFQKFDAIIVLGRDFDEEKLAKEMKGAGYKFGTIVAKRRDDTGSAGGFFTGQKFASENGYAFFILADVDCLPVDAGLLEELYASRAQGYVSPHEIFEGEEGFTFTPETERELLAYVPPTHYTLFSTSLLGRYGFFYMPIYGGADDAEYAERIKEARHFVRSRVRHPFIMGDRTYRRPDRFWSYTLNTILVITGARRFVLNFFRTALSLLVMFLFFPAYGREMSGKMLRLIFSYTYGRQALEAMRTDYDGFILPQDAASEGFEHISYQGYIASTPKLIAKALSEAFSNFRKRIAIDNSTNDLLVTFSAIWAKELRYRVGDGKYLLFADNSDALLHALKLIAFLLLAPAFSLALFALFLPLKLMKQPRTIGYEAG